MTVPPSLAVEFPRLGFTLEHTPGVARAWRQDLDDGSYLLVTDVGGYELPHRNGPFSGLHLSPHDVLLDSAPWLPHAVDCLRWVGGRQAAAESLRLP